MITFIFNYDIIHENIGIDIVLSIEQKNINELQANEEKQKIMDDNMTNE